MRLVRAGEDDFKLWFSMNELEFTGGAWNKKLTHEQIRELLHMIVHVLDPEGKTALDDL